MKQNKIMKTLKIIAILLNFIFLFYWIYILATEGIDLDEIGYVLLFLLISALPIINLIVLFKSTLGQRGDGWLSLLLKRKALEEKKKISALKEKE